MTEAEAELGLCEPVVTVPDVWSKLHAQGVRGGAVTGGDAFAALHVAAVVFLANGLFEFAHNMRDAGGSVLAVIIPMIDIDGRAHDFVACDTDFKRSARWRRTLPILGMDRVYGPRIDPLSVFRGPLQWLQAGRDGIVICSYRFAAKILCDGEPLSVDDAAFGSELDAKLRVNPPRIFLRKKAAA